MPKLGRNDPCHCGSGKKYKSCHLPLEEAARADQRRLQQANDTLMAKLAEAAQGAPEFVPAALDRYWNGKYAPEQLAELDELESRGADRFITWFLFDFPLNDGRTLVERLEAGEGTLELEPVEEQLLHVWAPVRLRPYVVEEVHKGQELIVRDLLDGTICTVEDRAASRGVLAGEVLVVHLMPVGDRFFIGGAAAHLSADTADKLHEFADLHLEAFQRDHPGAGWADLLRARSEVLNHFVMQLPVEEANPTLLDQIVTQTRVALQLTGESLGLARTPKKDE